MFNNKPIILKQNTNGKLALNFKTDAFNLRTRGGLYVENLFAIDTLSLFTQENENNKQAHRDFLQIIIDGRLWEQYTLGEIADLYISNCTCYSRHSLQGIFMSDGIIRYIECIGNKIITDSYHEITLSGVIDGYFEDNTTLNGLDVKVELTPARIGGNAQGEGNLWVNEFRQEEYKFKPIEANNLLDRRKDFMNTKDRHLYDFDLLGYQQEIAQTWIGDDIIDYTDRVKQIALDYGKLRL